MIIGTLVMTGVKIDKTMTAAQIEEKARGLGMEYPGEHKVINKKDVGK